MTLCSGAELHASFMSSVVSFSSLKNELGVFPIQETQLVFKLFKP